MNPQQESLVDLAPEAFAGSPASAPGLAYRATVARELAGITYRQIDYWARSGLVEPSVAPAAGSGTSRLYSFKDIVVLKLVRRLLDTGISLQNIRTAITHLRERGIDNFSEVSLFSDGTTIYECTTASDVVDLLAGGQGVFGIAVAATVREVAGTIVNFPAESVGTDAAPASITDELAARRAQRAAG